MDEASAPAGRKRRRTCPRRTMSARPDRIQRGGRAASTRQGLVAIVRSARRLPRRPAPRSAPASSAAPGPRRSAPARAAAARAGWPAAVRHHDHAPAATAAAHRPNARQLVASATRPGADPGPHHRRRLAAQRPQRQRQADRRPPVVPPRLDAPRHHRDHRAAGDAPVPAAGDHRLDRGGADLERATDLAVTQAMAVQTDRAARPAARRTLHRGHCPGRASSTVGVRRNQFLTSRAR